MGTFLETCNLPKLKKEEIENFNRQIPGNDTESAIKKLPTNKISGAVGFTGEFFQIFKESMCIYLKLFQIIEEEVKLINLLYKASITEYQNQKNTLHKKEITDQKPL